MPRVGLKLAMVLMLAPSALMAEAPPLVADLVTANCVDCHGEFVQEAGLRLDTLAWEPGDPHTLETWVKVHDRLSAGEMPPPDADQPTEVQRRAVVAALQHALHTASLASQVRDGRAPLRRLNRRQHETTLNDLLHVQVDLNRVLPDDGSAHGFDTVGEALDVSSAHLIRYQQAADLALDAAIPWRPRKSFELRRTSREIVEAHANFDQLLGKSMRFDGERLYLYARTPWYISITSPWLPEPGRYRVRVIGQAVNTGGKPLPIQIVHRVKDDRSDGTALATFDLPADKPREIVFETVMQPEEFFSVNTWSLRNHDEVGKSLNGQSIDKYDGPGWAIDLFEVIGPLEEFPPAGYRELFDDLPLVPRSVARAGAEGRPIPEIPANRRDDQWENDPLIPVSTAPREDAERLLRRFLPRAFRRSVDEALIESYVQFFAERLDAGMPFHEAMRSTYRAVLSSPHFFYFREQPGSLDDHAVAARLSYFLWNTLPDEELTRLADEGHLREPDILRAQVDRMLADPRSERFVQDFCGQWLELNRLHVTTPDPARYGEFDEYLAWSIRRETESFFAEVLQRDLSVANFVDSDWTMLNDRLARHYGLTGIEGGELRRVALPADSERGGVLTQASVLKVTADGTTTSPILRGIWVLERILGQPPSPPPPNLPTIEPDIRGATTIREQLAKHQESAACATCHRHIDPPGFALESFDVIGGYREFYRASKPTPGGLVDLANYPGRRVWRGLAVERGGVGPDGRAFADVNEYKSLLLEDREQIARNLTRQLLTYGTGAGVEFADREVIETILARTRPSDFGLRSILQEVVQSRVFLNK